MLPIVTSSDPPNPSSAAAASAAACAAACVAAAVSGRGNMHSPMPMTVDENTQMESCCVTPQVPSSTLAPATVSSLSCVSTALPQQYHNTWGILRKKHRIDEEIKLEYRFVDGIRDTYVLGRSRGCDIPVDNKRVSSKHCLIFCDYTQARMRVYLQDQSVNGTYINDAFTKLSKGEKIELRSGDEIYLLNPRCLLDAPDNLVLKEELYSASFSFVNIRDRIAANREVIPATGLMEKSVVSVLVSSSSSSSSKGRNIEDFYIIGDKIGSGMSGQVYFCIERATQRRCAVKEIDTRKVILTPGISIEDLKQEAKLMQQLKHVSYSLLPPSYPYACLTLTRVLATYH